MLALKTPFAPRPATRRARLRLECLDERALPSGFRQTNLVSDVPGQAPLLDPSLIDARGISLGPTGGAFWVSAHGTGTSPLYIGDVNGSAVARPFGVAIAGGAPTGQVFNGTTDFVVRSGTAAAAPPFIFAADTGFVTGWSPVVPPGSRLSLPGVSRPGAAAYTGLALANTGTANFLYAADMKNGRIDVFDTNYAQATLAGTFTDPNLPAGYAPYNIQAIAGKLYVTYTRASATQLGLTLPGGVVNEFDTSGNFLRRIATDGGLFSPWGLAQAPANFGAFSNDLLVANHGTGTISAYDLTTGQPRGLLSDERGLPVQIDGLYGLAFGNGATAGDKSALYFAAGPRGGQDGLFGSLRFIAGDPPGPVIVVPSMPVGLGAPTRLTASTVGHLRPVQRAAARRAKVRPPHATQAAVTAVQTQAAHHVSPVADFDLILGEKTDG